MRQFMRTIMLAPCLLAALWLAAGCVSAPGQPQAKPAAPSAGPATVEEQISTIFDHLQDDISHRRLPRVLAVVSDAYKDDAGRDINAVKQFLSAAFRDYREIHVTRTPPKFTVQGNEVRAIETLGVIGEPESGKVPPFSFQGNVAITLRRVEDTWQITKLQLLQ